MIGLRTDQESPRKDPIYFEEISLFIKFHISLQYSKMDVIAFYVPLCGLLLCMIGHITLPSLMMWEKPDKYSFS
jgi:hypothetical protein